MANLVKLEKVSLKNNPEIKEDMIQSYIFNNPSVLGLGDLTPIQREKIQPMGGRLDLLMADDNGTRYEIEVQLGATDPSHIIRTIEYWDTEKKRYPQYDHCAVIVAEEITGRFMNVISLFNGSIPLIALQVSAYKMDGNNVSLAFTKVLDRLTMGTEEEESYEITDRNYWENKTTVKMMKNVDSIFGDLQNLFTGYELKYNKFYIGLTKEVLHYVFLGIAVVLFIGRLVFHNIFQGMEDETLETEKRIDDGINDTDDVMVNTLDENDDIRVMIYRERNK